MFPQVLEVKTSRRARISHSYGRFLTVLMPLLSLLVIIGTIAAQMLHFTFVQANERMRALPDTISPLLSRSQLLGLANPRQHISLSIGLRTHNAALLTHPLQDLSSPSHHPLSHRHDVTQFSPDEVTYQRLQEFLLSHNFTITDTYNHHLLLDFDGTIAQAEQVFHIAINIYRAPDKQIFYANNSAPQLPSWLVGNVLSINGLSNARLWQHVPLPTSPSHQQKGHPLVSWCPGPTLPAPIINHNPAQNEQHDLTLLELNTFQISDLSAYMTCLGQTHTALQTTLTSPTTTPDTDGLDQVEQDTELVLNTSPHPSSLHIYATEDTESGYLSAWARIVQDDPSFVISPWQPCTNTMTASLREQVNTLLQVAALQGQHIVSLPGTSGNANCVP